MKYTRQATCPNRLRGRRAGYFVADAAAFAASAAPGAWALISTFKRAFNAS